MSTSPKTLRTRNMTAAKRSLSLIEQEVGRHRTALDAGEVPESGFAVYVLKYESSLAALRTLGSLDGDAPAEDATETQAREDLGVLVRLVSQITGPEALAGDTPLGRLAAVAYPDGLPAVAAAPEQEG